IYEIYRGKPPHISRRASEMSRFTHLHVHGCPETMQASARPILSLLPQKAHEGQHFFLLLRRQFAKFCQYLFFDRHPSFLTPIPIILWITRVNDICATETSPHLRHHPADRRTRPLPAHERGASLDVRSQLRPSLSLRPSRARTYRRRTEPLRRRPR